MTDQREARREARRAAQRAARQAGRAPEAPAAPIAPLPEPPVAAAPAAAPAVQNTTPRSSAPLPHPMLIARATGTDDPAWFDESGARTVRDWERALQVTGRDLDDFARILDFGCGAGRVLRHLREKLSPGQELIGVDVDAEAVAWVAANLPGIDAHRLRPEPASPFADQVIDLVFAQDVFTHLPAAVAQAWLADLARIMRPGAILLATFCGRTVWQNFREVWRSQGADAVMLQRADAEYHGGGFFHLPARNAFERPLPDYFGTAIHTIGYVDREWQRHFSILTWLPLGSLGHNDVVVLRRN